MLHHHAQPVFQLPTGVVYMLNPEGRTIKVAMIQGAGYGVPASFDVKANLSNNVALLEQCCSHHKPDIVLLPELFTTPYFCSSHDERLFSLAEPIPGPTTNELAKLAIKHNCYIFAPIFERTIEGHYYNSCALIDPQGQLVPGRLPDGRTMPCARKVHLASIYSSGTVTNEKYWFRPGEGLVVFDTPLGCLGCLICYDRSFPEAWRTIVLQGAEAVFIPMVSYGFRREMFLAELRTRALENGVFAIACNRGGPEAVDFEVTCYGTSCVVGPTGEIIVQGPPDQGPEIITAEIDLAEIARARTRLPLLRDRRPEVYKLS